VLVTLAVGYLAVTPFASDRHVGAVGKVLVKLFASFEFSANPVPTLTVYLTTAERTRYN
jgi:hypothetical protein